MEKLGAAACPPMRKGRRLHGECAFAPNFKGEKEGRLPHRKTGPGGGDRAFRGGGSAPKRRRRKFRG